MRHHTRAFAAFAATALAAALAAGCSSGDSGRSSTSSTAAGGASPTTGGTRVPAVADLPGQALGFAAPPATVTAKSLPPGKVLVTDKGFTLYLFEKDTSNKSTCTGSCATAWPPLLTNGKPTAGDGVQSKLLSTTKRGGNTTQVTYNNHPLYRFSGDTKPGQTNGQGLAAFGAKWFVLGTDGKKIEKTSSPSPSKTSGGY